MIVEMTVRFEVDVPNSRTVSRITGYALNDALRDVVERYGARRHRGVVVVSKYPHDPDIGYGITIDTAWAARAPAPEV
jgi:hypothetical protein